MNKAKTANQLVGFIAALLILLGVGSTLAQTKDGNSAIPTFLSTEPDGIVFYGVTWRNERQEIGRLPSEFSLFLPGQSAGWLINMNGDFALSPNQKYVAFVATRHDEPATALFVYNFDEDTLIQANTDNACAYNYPVSIQWSPDSLGITTDFCQTGFIYLVDRDGQIVLADDYRGGYGWTADSSKLLYLPASQQTINLFDISTDHITVVEFQQPITPSPLMGNIRFQCGYTWVDSLQSWFFEVGCVDAKDWPMDYLYSVNLQGAVQLEISLPDFYAAKFPGVNAETFHYLNLRSIASADAAVYLVNELGFTGQVYHSIIQYNVANPAQTFPLEIFNTWDDSSLVQIAFSPDKQSVALANYDGTIHVVALPSGRLIETIPGGVFDNEGLSYQILWLDDAVFVYKRTDGGVGVFHLGLADRVDTDLAVGLQGEKILFR